MPETPAPAPDAWSWRVFNVCTWTEIAAETAVTRDQATRDAQAWLLTEAARADNDEDATALDHAAQELNYATTAMVARPFEWEVSVVEIAPPAPTSPTPTAEFWSLTCDGPCCQQEATVRETDHWFPADPKDAV